MPKSNWQENVYATVLEIFIEAQERYGGNRVSMAACQAANTRARRNEQQNIARSLYVHAVEAKRIQHRDQARKTQMQRHCACGCGKFLLPSKQPGRKKYYSHECSNRVCNAKRTAERKARRGKSC